MSDTNSLVPHNSGIKMVQASQPFSNLYVFFQLEKRSDDVTKTNLSNYRIGWYIQNKQNGKYPLVENQPVIAYWWRDISTLVF